MLHAFLTTSLFHRFYCCYTAKWYDKQTSCSVSLDENGGNVICEQYCLPLTSFLPLLSALTSKIGCVELPLFEEVTLSFEMFDMNSTFTTMIAQKRKWQAKFFDTINHVNKCPVFHELKLSFVCRWSVSNWIFMFHTKKNNAQFFDRVTQN